MLSPYIPIKTLTIKMKIKTCEIIKNPRRRSIFINRGLNPLFHLCQAQKKKRKCHTNPIFFIWGSFSNRKKGLHKNVSPRSTKDTANTPNAIACPTKRYKKSMSISIYLNININIQWYWQVYFQCRTFSGHWGSAKNALWSCMETERNQSPRRPKQWRSKVRELVLSS